jgi:hypothetical protein
LHGKPKQGRGVEYSHTRINGSYQEYDSQERTVLKSRVWVIAVIALGRIVALAIGTGIYVFLQMQQGVIV